MQNEQIVRLSIAAVFLVVGMTIGYIIGKRNGGKATDRLTQLQIASIPMFFAYLLMTATLNVQYSDLVATGILAITGGEWVGKLIAERAKR